MQLIVNALMLGGIYALIAAGFSLVYGVMNVLNIAHGAIVMIGAFLTYTFIDIYSLPVIVALPLVAICVGLVGTVLYKLALTLMTGLSIFLALIFTFGLSLALEHTASLIWGSQFKQVQTEYSGKIIELADIFISVNRLVALSVAIVAALLMYVFLNKTRRGLAIQATALSAESALMVGINVRSIYALTFTLAAGLAGIAGALYALVLPIEPYMGNQVMVVAFAAAVLGGLGSVAGAASAGLLLALFEVLATTYIGASYSQLIPFIVMILVLVVRPQGLFGRKHFAEVII